jgi:hypothetical protein
MPLRRRITNEGLHTVTATAAAPALHLGKKGLASLPEGSHYSFVLQRHAPG